MGIVRRERGRSHSYEIDGVRAEGVTTLIGDGIPKPALTKWAAKSVAEYVADANPEFLENLRYDGRDALVDYLKNVPWNRAKAAAARGTEVHGYAERLMDGEEIEVPDALAGHVESCVRFMDEWQPKKVLVETTVASRTWNYAGTLDLVADLPDGQRCLFDYKTTASGIYPETALQLAAYRYAEAYIGDDGTEMPMREVGIDCCKAVWVRADGYDVIPLDTGPAVFQVFLHAAAVARASKTMREWVGVPEVPR
jgi:hypothetical protein